MSHWDFQPREQAQAIRDRTTVSTARVMDGAEIDGLPGLRDYLMTSGRNAFVRQFSRKLLGYALGRAVQLSDEPLLDTMQSKVSVGELVDWIVQSPQFREIRNNVPREDR